MSHPARVFRDRSLIVGMGGYKMGKSWVQYLERVTFFTPPLLKSGNFSQPLSPQYA